MTINPVSRVLAHDKKLFSLTDARRYSDCGGWATDFCELADAIQNPRVLVTNYDRDRLAKGLPFGSMTNRHGESIRPQYRSEA